MAWFCAQIGSREHYAIPRALSRQGLLAGLVTDWYAFGGREIRNWKSEEKNQKSNDRPLISLFSRGVVSCLSSVVRSPAARAARSEAIPDALVQAFPVRSLLWKWHVRRLTAQGCSYKAHLQTDSAFALAVARLKLPPHEVFFGYSYASLEMLAAEKQRGVPTVLGQIDPGAVEFRLVGEEMARFPDLAGPPLAFPAAYYERNRCEWELATIIVVNSEWSRTALLQQGVPPEKLVVIPLAYDAPQLAEWGAGGIDQKSEVRSQTSNLRPLRVLFLGQVILRKGIQYLLEAARLLQDEAVRFDVVGPIGISDDAVKAAPSNVIFHGRANRDEAGQWYGKSDVFVLPTISDGFALTQLEAMAHGLPVIATPNCGEVVQPEKSGLIVAIRDSEALAAAIQRFARDRAFCAHCAQGVRARAADFSMETLGSNLRKLDQLLTDRRRA